MKSSTQVTTVIASLALDILHPKLVWEQEAAAVKQNMSGIVSMLAGMAMTAVSYTHLDVYKRQLIGGKNGVAVLHDDFHHMLVI